MIRRGALVLFALCAACGDRAPPPCERAVRHMVTPPWVDPPAMSDEERAVVAVVYQAALARCQREGLSDAQLDCILSARDREQWLRIGSCPALQARRPSWLIAPPPGALEDRRPGGDPF
jgi:hypothetical protein